MILRSIILHHHIFKNAGSTVDAALERQFPGAVGGIEGDTPRSILEPEALFAFIRDNPGLKVVTSHQARPLLTTPEDLDIFPVLFLRHPLDRALSVYEFERRQDPASGPGAAMASRSGFRDYVRWRLEPGHGAVIRNYQTLFLSARTGDMRTISAEEDDLVRAMAALRRLPVFGLVEQFDESMKRLAAALHARHGEVELGSTKAVNQTIGRLNSLEARLEQIREDLGPDTYADLRGQNALDLDLHRRATRIFADFGTTSPAPAA